jgi:hypothetical protein
MTDTNGDSALSNQPGSDPGEDPFDMSNLLGKKTGLPFVVWISPSMGVTHNTRVKISRHPNVKRSELTTVEIRPLVRVIVGSLSADDLTLLQQWVELNYDTLIGYWEGDIEDTMDAIVAVKPLSSAHLRDSIVE